MQAVAILGAGRIGNLIASELSKKYEIHVIDRDQEALQNIKGSTYQIDLTQSEELKKHIESVDLVVSAIPGEIGFQVLENVIQTGKPAVDISFFPEDPFQLDNLAKKQNITAIVDGGIAPGLSNLVAGYYQSIKSLKSFHCYVGGLPQEPELPWRYKAPFSPDDVLEEYTRPARFKEKGKYIQKAALSDPHLIETSQLGTLEAFNTDGLRTLLTTLDIPTMKEQTLRYPGHREHIELLRDSGFFKTDPVNISGCSITPRQLTSHLLGQQWKMNTGEKDCTYMRIDMEASNGKRRFELYDEYDEKHHHTSMARCTGFSCIAFVHLLMSDQIQSKGVTAPEKIGVNTKHYDRILRFLRNKGIIITDQLLDQ